MDCCNSENIELLNEAIKRFIEEKRPNDDDKLLLSRLLSQLESLNEEQKSQSSREILEEEPCSEEDVEEEAKTKSSDINIEKDEIVKELKKVERQNSTTHWLISIMIVLTVSWQISEVSLILILKDRLTNPLKHIGGVFAKMLKRRKVKDGNCLLEDVEFHQNIPQLGSTLKIPELPLVDLLDFTASGKKLLSELKSENMRA